MTTALVLKELRQHWLSLALFAVLLATGYLLMLGIVSHDGSGSRFEAVRRFLIMVLPLGILVLCNRLVVLEYQSKTQLFLESLPLPRSRMIAIKYVLGLGLTLVAVGLVFHLTAAISLRDEPLTPRFLAIMAARASVFTWCLYSLCFMMGLTGRYRVAIYVMGVCGLFALETITQAELARFGPFALVDAQFAFERSAFPRQALLASLAIGLGLVLMTLILSLVREGSVAALLAERMTHREKVTVAVLLLTIPVGMSIYEKRAAKEPFDLPGAVEARRDEVTVKVLSESEADNARALRLAQLVADETAAVQEYLALRDPPPIFITRWRELDAYHFERGKLRNAEGLLVRANFGSDGWQDARFLGWLLRELLAVWSKQRLEREPNLWVRDGFAVYWTCRKAAPARCDRRQLELRAAYGARHGFSSADPAQWLRFRELVGDDIAAAVAWRGIETLERRQGEGRCRDVLRAALDCSVPADARGMFHEWSHPLPSIVERDGGIPYGEFLAEWSSDLGELERSRRQELELIPHIRGELTFEPISDYTRAVRFRFESQPPPDSGRYALLYAELPAFGTQVEPSRIRREDALYPDQRLGELPDTFRRRTRFYSTFAVRVDALGCEIVSGWTRLEMP